MEQQQYIDKLEHRVRRLEEKVLDLESTVNGTRESRGIARQVQVLWEAMYGGVDWMKKGIAEEVKDLVDVRRGQRWNMIAVVVSMLTILGAIISIAAVLSNMATTGGP